MNKLASKDLINRLLNVGIERAEAKKEVSILLSEFGETNLSKIEEIINERVKSRMPIQYLIGKAYFMDLEVRVNKNVLIPRPETEVLVEETINRLLKVQSNDALKILDIGTGTGVIPIAICRAMLGVAAIALDIEEEIIKLGKENSTKYSLERRIDFKVCDLFSESIHSLFKENKFDLIISNPPYIKENKLNNLHPEVSLHEPKIALSGSKENKTGLAYYERIIDLTKQYLSYSPVKNNSFILALEIDPPLVNGLKIILQRKGFNNFEITKDYAKLDRCLFVYP